ncbi:dipicolinic acid synthetase subunit A [Caenibacillus caldisaponilyticus]|uniref:dipicolinic acid synthetase subunit A n=1 Tax=Caenibacillus caldisaponilyticus TaxID=1674942 RepID=UPI00098835FF|nr:dipicolinic acid synthetase subunit A [Caenibacillus caldisaponilyticus]
MLTGLNIVIMGGDARYLEVIRKLNEMDAQLTLIGFDQLDQYFNGAVKADIDDIDAAKVDAIVLPANGTDENGFIETIFSNKPVKLTEEWLEKTPAHCSVYSGIGTPYLERCLRSANRELVKLFERDDLAIYNSVPTAEGTLMLVIQNTDFTIHGANVLILGLGRTGMTLARIFHALGAKVKVAARRPEHLARIAEMGLSPFHIDDLESHVGDVDICLNTIPAKVLTGKVIAKMPAQALIVDIASKPGGTDFRYAEKRGIKAILAPSLPGIVAPKTAGRIIANVLTDLLIEKFGEESEEA